MNYFCVDNVDPLCFEVIKCEYSNSRKRFHRLAQKAYVQTALRRPFRNWLSQVQFCVRKEVPLASEQLLIGGNRRLRLIHPAADKSVVIHKHGFDRIGFDREVFARMGPAATVAPRFIGLDDGAGSFSEAYLVGTPVNRFPIDRQMRYRREAWTRLVTEVHRRSLRTVFMSDYLDQISHRLERFFGKHIDSVAMLTKWLTERAGAISLGLVFSHGDFQDANILISGEALHVIDWENATERSQLYDLATMDSGIRLAHNSAEAWCTQVGKWLDHPQIFPALEVPAQNRNERLAHAVIWWLEEIVFQLEDAQISSFSNMDAAIANQVLGVDVVMKFLSVKEH